MVKGKFKNMITEDDIEQALLLRLQHLLGFDGSEPNRQGRYTPLKQGALYD